MNNFCEKCKKCKNVNCETYQCDDLIPCLKCLKCKSCTYWKRIDGTFAHYVSTNGVIYSAKTRNVLKAASLRGGYRSFGAVVNNENKTLKVHQVVAKAFIRNPKNKKCVNHIDGDKTNNHVSNLEWNTVGENNQHAINTGISNKTKRRVSQYDLEGKLIKIHDTIRGAGLATKIDSGAISKVCKGNRKTAGKFVWKFTDANPNEKKIDLKDFIQVKDFPNYMISKKGIIYSKPYQKIMKQLKNSDGYLNIQLTNKGKRKSYLVHRLVALHFVKNDKNKTSVHFKDKDKSNINADNLKWV
jgi:hypothetical protein